MDQLSKNFAKNLRVVRVCNKLTQKALAKRARVTVSYVSQLEGGHRSPPLQTITRFAKALKVRPIYLLQENDVDDMGGDLRYATRRRRPRA